MGNSGFHWHLLRRWTAVCCATVAVVALSGGAASAGPAQDGAAAVIVIAAPDGSTSSSGWVAGTSGSADVDPATLPPAAAGSGASSASVTSDSACIRGASDITALSLLGGAVTATTVESRMSACLDGSDVDYDAGGSGVDGLQVLGAPADPGAGPIQVGDWGVLTFGESFQDSAGRHARYTMHLHLSADYGGVPAGTDIYVGYAAALETPPQIDPGAAVVAAAAAQAAVTVIPIPAAVGRRAAEAMAAPMTAVASTTLRAAASITPPPSPPAAQHHHKHKQHQGRSRSPTTRCSRRRRTPPRPAPR